MTTRKQCLLDNSVVIVCVTLVQAQARSNASMEREAEDTISPLAVELMAIIQKSVSKEGSLGGGGCSEYDLKTIKELMF